MADISENTVVEVTQNSQSQYRKYRYSIRLAHWKTRQDFLVKHITRCKNQIEKHKKKIEKYEEKLYEYESYMLAMNPVGEEIVQVKSDAANRLQEAIQEAENESDESDDESVNMQDDNESVATCDTVAEMRNTLYRITNR